jgi:hypothetical protein
MLMFHEQNVGKDKFFIMTIFMTAVVVILDIIIIYNHPDIVSTIVDEYFPEDTDTEDVETFGEDLDEKDIENQLNELYENEIDVQNQDSDDYSDFF